MPLFLYHHTVFQKAQFSDWASSQQQQPVGVKDEFWDHSHNSHIAEGIKRWLVGGVTVLVFYRARFKAQESDQP